MAGTGSLFFRERTSHGRMERRWVASLRMPDRSRPTIACSHDHKRADRHPCPASVANLETLRRIRDGLAPADLRTLTVGRLLVRWVNNVTGLRPSTVRQHEMIIRVHLEPAFRHRLLTQLVPSDVDAYLTRNDLDPQTLRHHRATMRRALSDALRDGYVDRNVAALSRAPRMDKAERRYLSAAEARRLIDTSRNERLWPLWTLLVTTGLRLSEALGLAWGDVDLGGNDATVGARNGGDPGNLGGRDGARPHPQSDGEGGRGPLDPVHRADRFSAPDHGQPVHVRSRRGTDHGPSLTVRRQLARIDGAWQRPEPKTRKSRRTVLLIPDAVAALAEQRRRQDADRGDRPRPVNGYVFTTATGLPLHGTNVLPPFRRALEAAGLPRITLHDLRHACATMMLEAGVALPAIAEQLGHSSLRVTGDLYAHRTPAMMQDASDRLARALA